MTPLEEYLAARPQLHSRWDSLRMATASTVPPLGRWLERKMYPESLRHMRSFADGHTLEPLADGTWVMRKGKKEITRSVPLSELIGRIQRPVTIVASGPSCSKMDWAALADGSRFVLAVNGAVTVLKERNIRPDLHVVVDRHFVLSADSHIRNSWDVPLVITPRAASHMADRHPGIFDQKPLALIERVNAWHGRPTMKLAVLKELNERSGSPFHFPEKEDKKCTIGWSDQPALGTFSGCTVVVSALQIAVYLGAKDIEILGMDLCGQTRAYEEGSAARPSYLEKQYADYILPSFEVMHRALCGRGVKVRNLSPVCPLPPSLFEG